MNWGHDSARQLKRIRVDSGGAHRRPLGCVDKVVVGSVRFLRLVIRRLICRWLARPWPRRLTKRCRLTSLFWAMSLPCMH